jgi:hypothetical protein
MGVGRRFRGSVLHRTGIPADPLPLALCPSGHETSMVYRLRRVSKVCEESDVKDSNCPIGNCVGRHLINQLLLSHRFLSMLL